MWLEMALPCMSADRLRAPGFGVGIGVGHLAEGWGPQEERADMSSSGCLCFRKVIRTASKTGLVGSQGAQTWKQLHISSRDVPSREGQDPPCG